MALTCASGSRIECAPNHAYMLRHLDCRPSHLQSIANSTCDGSAGRAFFRPAVLQKIAVLSMSRGVSAVNRCDAMSLREGSRPSRRIARCCACVALVVFAGCSAVGGPEYRRPDVPDKPQWSQLEHRELTTSEVIQPDWWTGFGDTELDTLIQRAMKDGQDLRIAALRLDKAGVQLGKDSLAGTPELTLAPTDTVGRQKLESQSSAKTRDTELLGAGLTWELDLWGKIRKEVAAAGARYRATEMDWRATHLALVASVAERYFQIRQFDEQVTQQQQSLKQAQYLLQIYQAQHAEGMVPETRIRSQKAEIGNLTTQLLDMQRGRKEAELKLATLVGLPAGELSIPVAPLRDRVQLVRVPEVLPADMLARRPDVLKAEFAVLEAHHLVGKARLARLPTFSLSAVAKTGASLAAMVINSWSFGLTTSTAGLFDRDTRIDVKLSEADVRIAREEYRKAVLQAYEEVEVALLNIYARHEQLQQLEQQVADLQVVRDVQDARLREGLVSQLEVFDTERSLLGARQSILSTYQQALMDTVILYKALGGGWPPENVGGMPRAAGLHTLDE